MRETFYPGKVSLALLSDLHARPYENVIRSLQRHKPELIAITGDIVGNPLGIDSLVAVFPAVPETEVVIKDCLNEAIEAQAVAQAMEHGKRYPVLPIGHVADERPYIPLVFGPTNDISKEHSP